VAWLLRMPAIAAGSSSAVLSQWQAHEGDQLPADASVAIVETDKAEVDLPVEHAGVLVRTLVDEGADVEVGAPIGLMADVDEQVDDVEALLASLGYEAPSAIRSQAVPAAIPSQTVASADPAPAPSAQAAPEQVAVGPTGGPAIPGQRLFTSPLARRMARDSGLAVEQLRGTGPGGRIVRRDVEAALAARADAVASAEPAPSPAAAPAGPGSAQYTDQPHSRIRKATAARLTESKQHAPHFYLQATAKVDELLALRKRINAGGAAVSINDLIVKAAGRAHTVVPAMNVVWTPEAIRSFTTVDVAIAVATERGLLTPVLRGVESMTLSVLAAASADLAERARASRLDQSELDGGTLTVTNLGMYGTEQFAAIINPPHAAILAVGAARQEPVVEDGTLTVGTVMHFTLSVDHRPVDGTVAAEWMRTFVSLVEDPVQILV
jgi:pyruvate dehydrogenase E2 component (dihydrolipoamide acetyltransferase)